MQSVHTVVLALMAIFASRSADAATPCSVNAIMESYINLSGLDAFICQLYSGYQIIGLPYKPSDFEIKAMCSSAECKSVVARALDLDPPDCTLASTGFLFRTDFLDRVANCESAISTPGVTTPTPSVTTPTPTPMSVPTGTAAPHTPDQTPLLPQSPSVPRQTPSSSEPSPAPTTVPTPEASTGEPQSPVPTVIQPPTTTRPMCGEN